MAMLRKSNALTPACRWCALALVLLTAPGCLVPRRPDPPVDRSQDARIAREVLERLAAEPALDMDRLRVEVDGGIVVLFGSVDGVGAWNCAIRNAQLVSGVRSVTDYLVIERGPRDPICHAGRKAGPRSMARILPRPTAPRPE